MLTAYSEEQLLSHLTGLGAWTAVRAGELRHFVEHLEEQMAAAGGRPGRGDSLRYALGVYIDGVEDLVRRCREVEAELVRRAATAAEAR
jgi:hypothetical protein